MSESRYQKTNHNKEKEKKKHSVKQVKKKDEIFYSSKYIAIECYRKV